MQVGRVGRRRMPIGIREHMRPSCARRRRASPRSPADPIWLSGSCHETQSSEKRKAHKRERPDEISGLTQRAQSSAHVTPGLFLVLRITELRLRQNHAEEALRVSVVQRLYAQGQILAVCTGSNLDITVFKHVLVRPCALCNSKRKSGFNFCWLGNYANSLAWNSLGFWTAP